LSKRGDGGITLLENRFNPLISPAVDDARANF